jgi:predicted SnoaL-like aldol condensation-catalyzing enzyme
MGEIYMERDFVLVNKEMVVDFLQLVVTGSIDAAYKKYVDMNGKHHNAFFPAGLPALQAAMKEDQAQSPQKQITIVNVLSDGDRVAVLSHLRRGSDDMAVVHLFRFKEGRIVELWDCGQVLPQEIPNRDGAF